MSNPEAAGGVPDVPVPELQIEWPGLEGYELIEPPRQELYYPSERRIDDYLYGGPCRHENLPAPDLDLSGAGLAGLLKQYRLGPDGRFTLNVETAAGDDGRARTGWPSALDMSLLALPLTGKEEARPSRVLEEGPIPPAGYEPAEGVEE